MNRVLDDLICKTCREYFRQPVVLKCGHTTCKSHASNQAVIYCIECRQEYSSKDDDGEELRENKTVASLIEKFACDWPYNEGVKTYGALKKQLDENDELLNNPDYFVHETIGELKNKVLLKAEQIKVQVDEIKQDMIDGLNEYEKRCKEKSAALEREEFESENERVKSRLGDWSSLLKEEPRVDRLIQWKMMLTEGGQMLKDLRHGQSKFQSKLLLDQYCDRKNHIDSFLDSDIHLTFVTEVIKTPLK